MQESPFFDISLGEHIASNDSAFAIWDGFAVSPGHALVIPKRLFGSWWEATAQERVDLFALVDEVRAKIAVDYKPAGYNIGINVGEASGQTIDHLHIHVIPRYDGDVSDPRGGVRHVIPSKGNYLVPSQESSFPALIDSQDERLLYLELILRLENPLFDRVDLVVSFIMKSGLQLIAGRLEEALRRGVQIRVLTTDYLQITDPDALTRLLDLADASEGLLEVRVFHDPSLSFHPKAYLFWSNNGEVAAGYIGSSNLSHSGIAGGIEWNLKVDQVTPLVASFENLWQDNRSQEIDNDWLVDYRRSRPASIARPKPEVIIEPPIQPVAPRPIQKEALTALEDTRIEGYKKGLVVMATGLGKTWLAAFDTARPGFRRVLFVAHREEILRQSRDIFRKVHPEASLGLFYGGEKTPNADVVFASIQTLTRHYHQFDADRFDYLVVDEFHHATAPSYQRVIDYFDPDFLLGLTATPDRTDGADLLVLCGDNLVFDCNMTEGIVRKELCPFQYWGIKDVVDYAPIPWRNGRRFDPQALTKAVETQERAAQALKEWQEKAIGPTLAFCASVTHAEFMKEYFFNKGVPSAAVHSKPGSDSRLQAVEDLRTGAIKVLFSVDIFNEGVDIPEIGSVLMLRPTESPIIFLQQLGRGLRIAEGKEALQVIDFVGNHHSFLLKPRVLLGLGTRSPSFKEIKDALDKEDFNLPPGCSVSFELEAVDLLKSFLPKNSAQSSREALKDFCTTFVDEHGVRPTAAQVSRSGYDPAAKVVKEAGGWHPFLDEIGLLPASEQPIAKKYGAILKKLAAERTTKSYKLVTLKALIRLGALHTGAPISEIAGTSLGLIRDDPRLRAEVTNEEIPDLDAVTESKWQKYWLKFPLTHLTDKENSLFNLTDERMEPKFTISEQDVDGFNAMAAEIIEWRLLRHLLDGANKSTSGEMVLRLSHAGGRPILFFERDKLPEMPSGQTPFTANGKIYTGNFVKIALNAASLPGEKGNALHGLLRGWFGPDAGLAGTKHEVGLVQVNSTWVMRPLGGARTETAQEVQLFPSFAVACGALDEPSEGPPTPTKLNLYESKDVNPDDSFVVFAEGDSMDGGADPVKSGEALLFESAHNKTLAELTGKRVLVETNKPPRLTGLKRLARGEAGGWKLESDNSAFATIDGDSSMRVTAQLVRRLSQREINPLTKYIGEPFKRADVPALYGHEFNVGNWNTGHVSLEQDAILFVTMTKGEEMILGSDYHDGFESPSIFVWTSQNSVGPDSKKGKEVLQAPKEGTRVHLWARHKKSTVSFEYCGLIMPISHEGEKPMTVRFRMLSPATKEAMNRLNPTP